MKKIEKLVNSLFEMKISLLAWTNSFLAIITARIFVEQFLAKAAPNSVYEIVIEYIHNYKIPEDLYAE